MIDFEQEIETRLALFQHLTGKGNIKDGNHTLYEIVRLMLGMIHQNGNGKTIASAPVEPPAEPDTPALSLTEPSEKAVITPDVLAHPTAPLAINNPPVAAPYGYTRAGHARLTPPPFGLLPNGQARRGPRPTAQR